MRGWLLAVLAACCWLTPPANAYGGYLQGANYVPSYSRHDVWDTFTSTVRPLLTIHHTNATSEGVVAYRVVGGRQLGSLRQRDSESWCVAVVSTRARAVGEVKCGEKADPTCSRPSPADPDSQPTSSR